MVLKKLHAMTCSDKHTLNANVGSDCSRILAMSSIQSLAAPEMHVQMQRPGWLSCKSPCAASDTAQDQFFNSLQKQQAEEACRSLRPAL